MNQYVCMMQALKKNLRAAPHKARLTALHAICVQIFRHIAQKSDYASYAQALCSVSFEIPFSPASIPHCPTILKISGKFS